MALSFGDAAPPATIATPLEPFPFSGDWATDCRLLGGTVTDFNLILDRRAARGSVTPLRLAPSPQRHAVAGDVILAYVVAGEAAARLSPDGPRPLAAGETLLWRRDAGPGTVELSGAGAVLVVDIRRISP
jgi:environmental stress-induced protein Ves